ncbi:ATP-binding cassette domain-containing protein [Actinomadura sp. B10D3]|uniref:ATP-binding cassette domain-containing protein n=1 Tax=Actinomadura sp. B10D3 TaxID=3153557 RepID=UPI00325E5071
MRAVDGVGFSVRSGRTLALLGESGCGKSMTARAVAGLLDPVAHVAGGTVRLAGKDVLTLDRAARREAAAKAAELMERAGIPDPGARMSAYPHQFSGGMRQRLLIAMADRVAVMYLGRIRRPPSLLDREAPAT